MVQGTGFNWPRPGPLPHPDPPVRRRPGRGDQPDRPLPERVPAVTCALCSVPVHTQFASAELVGAIVEGGLDPADDPGWADSGAGSRAEYARWAGHLCGVTCLRMALGAGAPSLFELRDGALKYGAYTEDADGTIRGLVYAPFAEYVRRGARASRPPSTATWRRTEILALLDAGRTVMASVHYGIRHPERPGSGPGRSSGAGDRADGRTARASTSTTRRGRTPRTRAAELPLADFERFFAGRGVSLA